ncbi:3-methyl-2-oxobutanoate hydroxymethyltransferase [Pichia kluyveri]|uniref:3-methyl-2-oxobutanoate hydroxymethyltransferase n=1 Tax=Pichia kluyveri TaxID=36015 RepID=A0AAV5RC11_PICKL|nr:3-methyl-2-oxobutanoate hydroxymethyltransferase [Pichia kluyveri]
MTIIKSIIRKYSTHPPKRQSSLSDIYKLYKNKTPITVITAHDYITGKIADKSSKIDAILVGDSLAMVAKGHPSTLELEFDDFYYSTKSVIRSINEKFLIVDLPFGSFESSINQCIDSAIKLMKLGKIGSIKLEGSYELTDRIKTLNNFGIPVTGHIGLQPQKFNLTGGFKAQGRNSIQALEIFKQALHLQEIGCKLIVLECIPEKLSHYITENLNIPTIGIGAGNKTSGQVLVMSDALGMLDNKLPKFVNPYLNIHNLSIDALNNFGNDVKNLNFPVSSTHTYPMNDEEFEKFQKLAQTCI